MKKLLFLLALIMSVKAWSTEIIRIQTPYTPAHSGTPALMKIIDVANQSQKKYTFILEFKPGGNQIIAIQQMDLDPQRNLAVIAPAFVENVEKGALKIENYVPLWSLGDACWLVISTASTSNDIQGLRGSGELVVGTVGLGNASHITALQIGKKYNVPVKMVPFKSNFEAVTNMAGNNGVNLSIDTPQTFENFRIKNDKLRVLAASCDRRLPEYPQTATLREQGIIAPTIMNIVVANVAMPDQKRQDLAQILEKSANQVGEIEIRKISGFHPPQFNNLTAKEHFTKSIELIKKLRKQFEKEIKQL
jgi:tripartite-type tricarboxylate transporter receptor subunit TctC